VAFANASYTDIITSSIESRTGEIADNVTKNNAILYKLQKRGNVMPVSGGSTILQEISFQENSNFEWYSGYDQLSVQAADVITSAKFDFKQCACPVVISGLEELQNSGKEAILDLLDARMNVAEATMENNMAAGVYSDGTGFGGKQIIGLALAVSLTPTSGVYGGIDPSVWSFWANQLQSGGAQSAATIQLNMNALYNNCTRGKDHPDLGVADTNLFGIFEQSLQALQRFSSAELGDLGFQNLKYKGMDVVLDGGVGGFAPLNLMYMLNTKYIFLRPHAKRNMVPLSNGRRLPVNQDAELEILAWAGAFTTSGRRFQGVLKGF
jgi:hypothetical protein